MSINEKCYNGLSVIICIVECTVICWIIEDFQFMDSLLNFFVVAFIVLLDFFFLLFYMGYATRELTRKYVIPAILASCDTIRLT